MYNAFISYSHTADEKFAPALQDALQKFAKPWYKKRNLEIFRDESSLSASPHLWKNIVKALDNAEYLIILASAASEKSKWVNKEVAYWLENKSIDNILIALTEGELEWDEQNNCFLKPANNSLPPALDDKFDSEPFYIDLRESKKEVDLSLDNPIFKKEILKLAAKLHGKQPNDLASEEVLVHRKMIRLRNGAIGLLVLLLIAALIAGFIANENRKEAAESANEARRQQRIAIIQKDSADRARAYAVKQENIAKLARDTAIIERDNAARQREIAIEQRNEAQANYLVSEARSTVGVNPTVALRLLEQAMQYHSSRSIEEAALNIYYNNNFYKSVDDAEITNARLQVNVIDTGLHLQPARSSLTENDLPYITDFANQKKIQVKLPFRSNYRINLSMDRSHIIAFSKRGEIKIRRIKGKKIENIEVDSVADINIVTNDDITDVEILPGKKMILIIEDYATIVRIFDFEGKHIQDLKGHQFPINTVFSPDGKSIYTSSKGYYMTEEQPNRKWNVGNTLISESEGAGSGSAGFAGLNHNMKTDGITWSPDGKTYLQNRWSDFHYAMVVSLFDMHGRVIADFFDPLELITAVSFSPDGKYIFTGAGKGTAKLYSANGMLLRTFNVYDQKEIVLFSFTSDKKNVLIFSKEGRQKLWKMPMPLENFLRSNDIELLTTEQLRKYGIK
jgi:hypothetical protein